MAKKKAPAPAKPDDTSTIMMSARVPPDLFEKVKFAAARRRTARTTPYTVQDIMVEALRSWLTAHGHG